MYWADKTPLTNLFTKKIQYMTSPWDCFARKNFKGYFLDVPFDTYIDIKPFDLHLITESSHFVWDSYL